MQINASPQEAHAGDIITLSGSIEGVKTIVVYLFLTGPGLPPQGVELENLNVPAGRGLLTTAPVDLADGTWTYIWDTSAILGSLKPGNYSVHAVISSFSQLRSEKGENAVAQIEILPPDSPAASTPASLLFPFAALVIVITAIVLLKRRIRKRNNG